VLEGVEAEIGLAGGVRMAVDGDYAAFFAEFVGAVCTAGGSFATLGKNSVLKGHGFSRAACRSLMILFGL
jgi:hypothetical protein